MAAFTLESTAKINVFLKILGKRADGFHSVRTWMLPISLGDTMRFEKIEDTKIEISCSDPSLPTDQSNLVRKAAELLQSRYQVKSGSRIHLEKRIPIGAGLGGGSSNGSTTLVGLNQLWNLKLSDDVLEKLSAEFGSDTAFFIRKRSALSEGRGEILTYVPYSKSVPIFLMNFGFGSATSWAYKHLHAGPLNEKEVAQPFKSSESSLASILHNDLEKPVFKKFPILKLAKDFLISQPQVEGAMMCGSGSTMMAVLKNEGSGEKLRQAAQELFGKSVWTWTGSTLAS
jgi:4-diphosphocytidyl-2-C-methyl-D-erythritol kinase